MAIKGVYIFYSHNRTPLYIGRSKDCELRIKQHLKNLENDSHQRRKSQKFYNDSKEITFEIIKTNFPKTVEAHKIKELKPLFNERLETKNLNNFLYFIHDSYSHILNYLSVLFRSHST